MEEELSFLRRKVNRLEDMIFNINDKIGLILEKFLNHRASHVAGIREVLQVEEDICLLLVTQLKSCIINSSSSDRNSSGSTNNARTSTQARTTTRSSARQQHPAPSQVPNVASEASLPPVVLTRQSVAKSNPVTVNPTSATGQRGKSAPGKKRRRIMDDEEEEPEGNPLENEDEDSKPSRTNFFTINIKPEQPDISFQPEDGDDHDDGGLELDRACGDNNAQRHGGEESEYEESKSSDEEGSDGDGDDPDFSASTSATAKAKDPHPRSKESFVLSRTFSSVEEARAQINAEGEFRFRTRTYTPTGVKYYFKCRWARYGNCLVKTPYLMVNEMTGATDEFVSPDPPQHTHGERIDKRVLLGLPPEVKAVIDDIILRPGSATPMNVDKIYEELIRRGFKEATVPKHKINNYMAKLKKRRFGDLSFMKRRRPAKNEAKATSSASAGTNSSQERPGPDSLKANQRAAGANVNEEGSPATAGSLVL